MISDIKYKLILSDIHTHFKAAVFDLDGLLVDTEPLQLQAYQMLLASHGITLSEDEFRQNYLGRTANFILGKIRDKYDLRFSLKELIILREGLYSKLLNCCLKPMPGAVELVTRLARIGVKLAIASSSPRSNIVEALSIIGILKEFAVIVGGDDVKDGKPNPEAYNKAVSGLGYPANMCVAFEDSLNGVRSALSAGLFVVVAYNELTKNSDFTNANLVFSSLLELDDALIKKLFGRCSYGE